MEKEQFQPNFGIRKDEGEPETFEPNVEVAQKEATEQDEVRSQLEMARQLGLPQKMQDKIIVNAEEKGREVREEYKKAMAQADSLLFELITGDRHEVKITEPEGVEQGLVRETLRERIMQEVSGNEYTICFSTRSDSPGGIRYETIAMEKVERAN